MTGRKEKPVAPRSSECTVRVMPDIASEAKPVVAGALSWVGMGEIETPVSVASSDGRMLSSGAKVNAYNYFTIAHKRALL